MQYVVDHARAIDIIKVVIKTVGKPPIQRKVG